MTGRFMTIADWLGARRFFAFLRFFLPLLYCYRLFQAPLATAVPYFGEHWSTTPQRTTHGAPFDHRSTETTRFRVRILGSGLLEVCLWLSHRDAPAQHLD